MSTTFSNALSGLNASSLAIDVVSGNLANLNTTGYKGTTVSFQDLINQSLGVNAGVGINSVGGSTIAQTSRSFSQGSVQATGQDFDAAIQGNGFFVLRGVAGQQGFTRAGNFKVDASGHLVTQSGQFVQGWSAQGGVLNASGGVSDITVPIGGLRQPVATKSLSALANLNANAVVGSADGTFSSPVPVIDAQGNTHTLTVTYTRTAADTWGYNVTIPAADLANPSGSGRSSTIASGSLTFDGNGHLTSPPATAGPITLQIAGLSNGAADMSVSWNVYDSGGVASFTQYSQASANLGSTQDGTPSGQLTNVSIGTNGQVLAHYSNGDSIPVAQLALASILNPDSMQDLGQNTFGITSATSLPSIGVPDTGSRGQISGGALEGSTVDIAKEFTNLLIYERGYQANSKVITTEDDILQQTVALKR
jgi:flagellar hook protein FlgE